MRDNSVSSSPPHGSHKPPDHPQRQNPPAPPRGTVRGAPLVRLESVTVGFPLTPVFSGLSLSLFAGEHLALLGANGTGKSTLLRLIQGELRPAQDSVGRIFWCFGEKEESSALAAREHVRMVSLAQQSAYVHRGWNITGEEILLSGLDNAAMIYGELSAVHYAHAAALAEEARAAFLLGMSAPAMSQGQLRLALILRALMSSPALLLLDEPFDGLDGPVRRQVADSIALAAQRGSTVLVSAHRGGDVPDFISEALVIDSGRLQRRWLNAADSAALLVAGDREPDETVVPPSSASSPSRLSGGVVPVKRPRAFNDPGNSVPLFELRNVDVFIERRKVLFDISWTVRSGERWVVSGRNGAGKSTLLRLLYGGEFAAYGGSILWCGNPRPGLEELRTRVGYVSDRLQDVYDYALSAEDVVISGLRGSIGLYLAPDTGERAEAKAWLERMGLSSVGARPFHALSGGLARRVLLARALAGAPQVLLLDEPCSGLDAKSRALFLRTLSKLASQGVTLIYVSHHEDDASTLFTHELHLEAGKVLFAGRRKEAQPPPCHDPHD